MVRQQQVDIKITEFMHDMYGGQAVSVQCGICYLEDLAEDLQIEGILDRANYARKTVKQDLTENMLFMMKVSVNSCVMKNPSKTAC